MNGIAVFFIVFFSILFLAGLLIGTYFWTKHRIKNNPENAVVLVKNGAEIVTYKGKLKEKPSKTGSIYHYSESNVLVPNKYEVLYNKNRRLIFLSRIGQLISSPFNENEALSPDERDELIYELTESHIGSDAMKAIKGKSSMNIILIAVIAFVIGIIAVLGYNFIQKQMNKNNEIIQPTDNNNGIIIEYDEHLTDEIPERIEIK